MSQQHPEPGEFITKTDVVPELWQFILGLRPDDLVAELIQNELDAGSTHTVITFDAGKMTCFGNGESVDAEGWVRLSFLKGAGDLAPKKRNLIGIKNHGLKACFAIGSDIAIRSNGLCARQTLHGDGPARPPRPGASPKPFADDKAPKVRGTEIEVTYRARSLAVITGEEMVLPACTPAVVEALFRDAARTIAGRFMGVVRPRTNARYTVELRHHAIGSVKFEFAAGRESRAGGIRNFIRTCKVSSANPCLNAPATRERVVLGACQRPDRETRDVADLYRNGNSLLVEVSWPEDARGRIRAGRGELRYPIAYANVGAASSTGVGAHYSAPFISDVERHGLAQGGSGWNGGLMAACDALLVKAIKSLALPRAGAKAMDLLVNPGASDGGRLAVLAAACLRERAVPLHDLRAQRGRKSAHPNSAWRVCLAPCFKARPGHLAPELALIAPPEHRLLAPGIRPDVVLALVAAGSDSLGPKCLVFSERDALGRLAPFIPSQPFGWSSASARADALSNPVVAGRHLDAIAKGMAVSLGPRPDLAPMKAELPDTTGQLRSWAKLKRGAALPAGLPGLSTPPLLHPVLAGHSIFRLAGWKPETFGFDDLLRTIAATPLDAAAANAIFGWLAATPGAIPPKSWPAFRTLPIWPAGATGVFGKLSDYCLPRSSAVTRLLDTVLLPPGKRVLRLAAALRRRRLSVPFRTRPTSSEVAAWVQVHMTDLPLGVELSPAERASFLAFEHSLARLAAEPGLVDQMEHLEGRVPGLSEAGCLVPLDELVDPVIHAALSLLPEHLSAGGRAGLSVLFPVSSSPTPDIVRAALRATPEYEANLLPRLKALATRVDRQSDLGVSDVPCIPTASGFSCPGALAFKGNEGNHWGEWRQELSGKGWAQVDQVLLKRAGVLSAEPDHATSYAFFGWLAADLSRPERHLPQIIRHFGHKSAVRSWWEAHPRAPCLPVHGRGGLSLIDHHRATSPGSTCYLNDFSELAAEIGRGRSDILIAVDEDPAVRRPIKEFLSDARIKSLRAAAGRPKAVTGIEGREAPDGVMRILEDARSDAMAGQLQKRVVALGIRSDLLVTRWHRHLHEISRVVSARVVTATYLLARNRFQVSVRHAFDGTDGILWLADSGDEGALEDAFFEALADRMFVPFAPPFCAPALAKALKLEMKISHQSFAQAPVPDGAEEDEEDPGEAPAAHYDWKPNPAGNLPSPGPLAVSTAGRRAPVAQKASRTVGRPIVVSEAEQVAQLKQRHYAWHCQIALAHTTPVSLAPAGSYVEHYENRKRLIDAHHPDAVDAGGSRHVGNVLILSHLAHHQFGRHISRAQITAALRKGGAPRSVSFTSGTSSKLVAGIVVEVPLPVSGEVVAVFFSTEHREFWLANAAV